MVNKTLTTLPRTMTVQRKRIVFGVLLLVALLTAGYYFGFVRLYKSDYAQMLSGVNKSTTAYNELLTARDGAINQLGEEGDTFTTGVDKYRQTYTKYQQSVTALGNERALRDPAVRISYDALASRNAKFGTFVSGQLKLLPLIQGVTLACSEAAPSKLNTSDLGAIVSAYDSAMKSCTEAMKTLATSTNPTAAKRATDNVAYFDAMRSHAAAMQDAYGASDRAKFESEYNALLDALAQYKTHIVVRDLLDIDKNAVPTAELNALAKTLSDRQK